MSFPKPVVRLILPLFIILSAAPGFAQPGKGKKLGPLAERRSASPGESRVIVQAVAGASVDAIAPLVSQAGGRGRKRLALINGYVATLPNGALKALAEHSLVAKVSLDRTIVGADELTGQTIGTPAVYDTFGYDGAGIGVAVIDSGITSWHDDLTFTGGGQRVIHFVDLVNDQTGAYDDYGHGTHVAGIIAGNGFDSSGRRTGIAPAASLVVLKALDADGRGYISDVIAALDYVVANQAALNIRIVNLSVATGVFESYESDPLTLAAKRAVDAGIVVVAAAGNNGRTPGGVTQYGGITAPGNAPWVLTVGASSHQGTASRADDIIAAFSSRGPAAIDVAAKPDLVAPGVGIESLSDPASAFYTTKAPYLLPGTISTAYLPYLSLSGTSMAAPVVTGTVALMLQANPALTPNAVKAILQYTAHTSGANDQLTEGAGFLNAQGAIELAHFFTGRSNRYPSIGEWGGRIIWGNRLVTGGRLLPDASAFASDVTWGAPTVPGGAFVEWGLICESGPCDSNGSAWQPWRGDARYPFVVWNLAWGPPDGETIILGAGDDETVVWGTADDETVVWGTADDETVVWGTTCDDPSCEPVVWPASSPN